jgi:undecaprenyl phosphate-alpha-L-ara4N flippase subunit ArnE
VEYFLLLLCVALTALSQVLQKLAARRLSIADECSTEAQQTLHHLRHVLLIRETWFALLSLGGSMLLWLWVLQDIEVSKAFPVISLSLVLVMLISRFTFGEHISLRRWVGAAVITLGVCLVASS